MCPLLSRSIMRENHACLSHGVAFSVPLKVSLLALLPPWQNCPTWRWNTACSQPLYQPFVKCSTTTTSVCQNQCPWGRIWWDPGKQYLSPRTTQLGMSFDPHGDLANSFGMLYIFGTISFILWHGGKKSVRRAKLSGGPEMERSSSHVFHVLLSCLTSQLRGNCMDKYSFLRKWKSKI
jgi:hypothetical protein